MNNDRCVTMLLVATLTVAVILFIICTKEIVKGVKFVKLGEDIFCFFQNNISKFV